MRKGRVRRCGKRLVMGLLLVVLAASSAAGATEAEPASDSYAMWGTALLGMLVVLSGLIIAPEAAPPKSMWGRRAQSLPSGSERPLLGELLVYKYELITEAQLTKALVRQRETGQKFGEVLVDLGLVSVSQIAIALADQQSGGDPFGLTGGADPQS